jgi:hypothetical protein
MTLIGIRRAARMAREGSPDAIWGDLGAGEYPKAGRS